MHARTRAIVQAFFVTFLWSTSWLLIRAGLQNIPPLTFAALRYALAAAVLWGVVFATPVRREIRVIPRALIPRLFLLGVVFYSITQASQFVALNHLPATTVSLLLNFSTIIAAIMAGVSLGERTRLRQWMGLLVYLGAAYAFLRARLSVGGDWVGYLAAGIGVVANAVAGVLGRAVNRTRQVSSLAVTAVSMTTGSAVLLCVALIVDGVPSLGPREWAILGWLAVVNTAFAFTLWNRAQQDLRAVETTVINSTMLFQISILAVLFLGERLSIVQWLAILIGGVSAMVVQLSGAARPAKQSGDSAASTES